MPTFASRVIAFNKQLSFSGKLPKGIRIMNPFKENKEVLRITEIFYNKFYNDTRKRKAIIGINPGRFGAGVTGIPFTDTKRLSDICGIKIDSVTTHEPSSVFVYDFIREYGGPEKFYGDYYINSICPLALIEQGKNNNWVNCNYYDYPELFSCMREFMIDCLKAQIGLGLETEVCYVLGKKNAKYLKQINDQEKLFGSLVILDHPRYIEQYKAKSRNEYIEGYLRKLKI